MSVPTQRQTTIQRMVRLIGVNKEDLNSLAKNANVNVYFALTHSVEIAENRLKMTNPNVLFVQKKNEPNYPMNTDDIVKMLEDAIYNGVIEPDCSKCGNTIRAEPDAETAYCDVCEDIVPLNGLAALGMI